MEETLIHIRVGKALKKKMQELIKRGFFATESEITREGIRSVILKYKEDGNGQRNEQK